nr:ATP-binding cassette domain-containing protein [Thermaerobacter sp.]
AIALPRTVESLTVGEQQRIEIIKAFYRGAKILILDEPTALLTPQETDRLFESIREFSRQGLAVVFISHKLDEVREIAPQVMVIRAGRVVGTVPTQHSSPSELARMMVGREVDLGASRRQSRLGDAVLTVTGLTASAKGGLTVGPIDLTIRAGEILGVAGVEGNGQHELVELLAGLRTPTAGTIQMGQQALQNLSVRRRLEAGLAYVPADRQGQGLVLDLKIWENFILRDYYRAPLRRGLGIDSRAARARAQAAADAFDIRTGSIELPSRSLSGGNQQKLLLAREMSRQPRVMIVSQPTRGLDVGAIEYVHRQLMVLADGGAGVLLVSLELDELMKLSDRILVLFRGQVHGIVDRAAFRREKVGLLMAGQVAREEEVAP